MTGNWLSSFKEPVLGSLLLSLTDLNYEKEKEKTEKNLNYGSPVSGIIISLIGWLSLGRVINLPDIRVNEKTQSWVSVICFSLHFSLSTLAKTINFHFGKQCCLPTQVPGCWFLVQSAAKGPKSVVWHLGKKWTLFAHRV